VLIIPPNPVVLVARAAKQFDDLSASRRLTMQSARFDPVAYTRRAGYLPNWLSGSLH
jgi:hypothetical protein